MENGRWPAVAEDRAESNKQSLGLGVLPWRLAPALETQ